MREKEIARYLLEVEAVSLSPDQPFTWASGIKSPIYCDNRITLSYPQVRTAITKGLVALIREKYPEVEVIAGTATAGIPQAALIAAAMDLPMIYIRGKAKDHGKARRIEGKISKGQKIVLVEDLISTGGSVIDAAGAARDEGAEVLGIVAIFTYELAQGLANFAQQNLTFATLTNYSYLLEEALALGSIKAAHMDLLKAWKMSPETWLK